MATNMDGDKRGRRRRRTGTTTNRHNRRRTQMLPYASSSSTMVTQGYDVFMSFRGEDTRTGFASHLYDALIRNKFTTYKDDKSLEIGRPIASELLEAIECSRIAIVVLSERFATSKWCLEEVAKIVDCMKQEKLIVIPVFYHVDPSDVRHQSKCFEQGFANHARDPEITPQKVETWRAAFGEVGALSGFHVTLHRDESEVLNKIVSKILKEFPNTILPINLHHGLVGIESRVHEMKKMLRMDSSEVLFVGICGMSGVGKTTLAEVVYQDIKHKFERSSLIENIKDISKQNDSTGLCKLQQKLLDDILGEKSIRVRSVTEGQALLGTKLRGFKVLIILDDVNHVDQLTYLAGGREWFGPCTRIIVTTTNMDLLNRHRITNLYFCEEMKGDEALNLFCQSAFKQSHPARGYKKLSDDIVKLTGGLPLALNLYGSLLFEKNKRYWEDKLKKLGQFSDEEVLERLEVVFARLDKDQRRAFIYIACFLRGRNQDLVKDILRDIGLYPECGITDLINKSLITINIQENVWMHDLLQQMSWEIFRKESHIYDVKAIKYHEDIVDILSFKPKGMRRVEIINQDSYKGGRNEHFSDPMCFSKMTKLKFLRISNVHFPNGLEYISNDLRILEWYGCSLKSLPSMFKPEHIYELDMCSSQLQTLWKNNVELLNLRSINLSFSKDLTEIPDLLPAPMLERLNLEGCTSLTRLHESTLLHKKLRYLNLKGCTCLESLGRRCMEMEALEVLYLSRCSKLEYIPKFGKKMKRLEHLFVDGTRTKKLPENLGEMCNLRKLDASGTLIEELPSSIHLLKKLRLLHVSRCQQLSFKIGGFLYPSPDAISSFLREVDLSYCNLFAVPDGIGLLCNLITLDLSGNEFVRLPASIGLLSKLRLLCLNNCKRLESLPKLSLVDEDMDYGPRTRFHYHISTKGVDVSNFHESSFHMHPTVSCLNCPRLVLHRPDMYVAEKILNNYLQLRTKYWKTPEAIFQILGAGSEIPSGFVDPGYSGLSLEGLWIGVATCVVISVHHDDGYMEPRNMVTTNIHLGAKVSKISVPVNFLASGSETQLVFYWRIADNYAQWGQFYVSVDVEPDSNLNVTKVGVQFIRKGYIAGLKQHGYSRICVGRGFSWHIDHTYKTCIAACEDDTNVSEHIRKIVDFILHNGRQQYSLDGIYHITKALRETNQLILTDSSVCKGLLWSFQDRNQVPIYYMLLYDEACVCYETKVYEYYVISVGVSVLYIDFVRSLQDINEEWVSVKYALEQIVVKSRADKYIYTEMLIDLEAANKVRFSYNFIKMFMSVCSRISHFLSSFDLHLWWRIKGENSEKRNGIG